jgi:hypothetical protein
LRRDPNYFTRADGTNVWVEFSRNDALRTTEQYTVFRKRQLIDAVQRGVVTRDEFMAAHRMGPEEFAQWVRLYATKPKPSPIGLCASSWPKDSVRC